MKAQIRIAVVDDHPIMREAIVNRLHDEKDFKVVATGGTAAEAISIAKDHAPHLMLLDLSMPGGGLCAARQIFTTFPKIRIVILTVSERREDVMAALEAGASGYILKGISGPDLVKSIRSVALGESYVTPEFAAKLLASPVRDPKNTKTDPSKRLTVREEQILKELSRGHTNREIAAKLNLTEKTVKHYMSGVLQKLSVRNRVEAIVASRGMYETVLDEKGN